MRQKVSLCVVPVLLLLRQCDVASPEAIKRKTEEQLRPFFPNARALVLPQRQAIIGFTCTQGVGVGFVSKMQEFVARDPQIKQDMELIRLAPLMGGAHYRYFLLAFDGGLVRYDLDARRVEGLTAAGLLPSLYEKTCGFQPQ